MTIIRLGIARNSRGAPYLGAVTEDSPGFVGYVDQGFSEALQTDFSWKGVSTENVRAASIYAFDNSADAEMAATFMEAKRWEAEETFVQEIDGIIYLNFVDFSSEPIEDDLEIDLEDWRSEPGDPTDVLETDTGKIFAKAPRKARELTGPTDAGRSEAQVAVTHQITDWRGDDPTESDIGKPVDLEVVTGPAALDVFVDGARIDPCKPGACSIRIEREAEIVRVMLYDGLCDAPRVFGFSANAPLRELPNDWTAEEPELENPDGP